MGDAHAQEYSASASTDAAGGGAAWGVGVETPITFSLAGGGLAGIAPIGLASVVYDAGNFHVDGLLGFATVEDGDTLIDLGGRVFFVVHDSAAADFSLGGGLSILHTSPDNDLADDDTDIHLEGGAKIRAFITPNVSMHAQVGVGVLLEDEGSDVLGIFGELFGGFGVTYFFR